MSANSPPTLLRLFVSFLRLGLTSFGGPTMVAYIRSLAVERQQWLDAQAFSDGVALCQTIPGATAMQTVAYVGLKTRGFAGAAVCFCAFALPAFLLMLAFAALYARHNDLPVVIGTFGGLQAIIVGVMANATVMFGCSAITHGRTLLIAGVAACLFGIHVHPIYVLLLAALAGFAILPPAPAASEPGVSAAAMPSTLRPLLGLLTVTGVGFWLLSWLDSTLFELAWLMFRIDLFAFGGGFASVPLMLHEVVHVRQWLDGPTFMNGIVFGQVTPGPIVITATFVGYLLRGTAGALVATAGIFLPSFLLLVGVAPHYDRLRKWPAFTRAIAGVLCCFVGLLMTTTVRFAGDVPWDLPRVLLALGALIALRSKVDIFWVILVGSAASALWFA